MLVPQCEHCASLQRAEIAALLHGGLLGLAIGAIGDIVILVRAYFTDNWAALWLPGSLGVFSLWVGMLAIPVVAGAAGVAIGGLVSRLRSARLGQLVSADEYPALVALKREGWTIGAPGEEE